MESIAVELIRNRQKNENGAKLPYFKANFLVKKNEKMILCNQIEKSARFHCRGDYKEEIYEYSEFFRTPGVQADYRG